MNSATSKPHKGVRPDMNVTPLVDVVLVLLIIFMLITPQMDKNVPVDLPGIMNPDPEVKSLAPVEITIARDGSLTVEKTAYDREGLAARLRQIHAGEPLRRAVLRGDQALAYKQVRELFSLVKDAGFPGVSLMVADRSTQGDEHGDDSASR